MKFVISSSELLRGLLDVSKAIPAKSAFPILENYLFILKGNTLEITASDTELRLKTTVEVESTSDEGKMAVPAGIMTSLLKELPDQPLSINTVTETTFECKWMGGQSTIPYFPADDYPDEQDLDDGAIKVEFDAQGLAEGISSTVYATADDDQRPTMNGILFDIEENLTTLVASDSHKLVCYTLRGSKSAVKASFILHKRPAAAIRSLIGKETETAEVAFDAKNVIFKFDTITATCRLISGKYPKYREVIPQNNPNVLKIERQQLLNTVRRIAVCSNKASNHIKFDLSPSTLEISAQDLGFSISAYEKIECPYAGDEISIGFKSTFLIDILSNMDCEEIVMRFSDGKRAALIIPGENEEWRDKICGIVMPIMV